MSLLAIVIPLFKITFFRETLESLAAQSDQRFTVYIGDDASPENPAELLKEFEGKFKFTYKRFDNNLGGTSLTQQWERCLGMTQGEEWFQILGDDDYLDIHFVESFNTAVRYNFLHNYYVVKCLSKIVNEGNEVILDKTKEIKAINNSAVECFIAKTSGLINSSLTEHIFSFKKYKEIGFRNYPLAWHSDDLALLQFSSFGKIFILKEAICYVRMSELSISGSLRNIKQKKIASNLYYNDVLNEIDTKRLTHNQKIFFAKFWSFHFPTKFNINAFKLYYDVQELNGVIVYLKVMLFSIFNKVKDSHDN